MRPYVLIVTNPSPAAQYATTDVESFHSYQSEAVVRGEQLLHNDPRRIVLVARVELEMTASAVVKRATVV
jgi:hypothetical protein